MPTKLTRKDNNKMSRPIDSTGDFKAYRNALAETVKPDAIRKNVARVRDLSSVPTQEYMQTKKQPDKLVLEDPVRAFVILGLLGFLVAWAALAIYGAIKLIEKIGLM